MQQDQQQPSFLGTFIGSFVQFSKYPEFSRRSLSSFLGQYLLLIVICCSLYAAVTTAALNIYLSPHLDDIAQSVPTITVKDGKATVDIEQPYFVKLENEVIAIIDTESDPEKYIDEHSQIIVIAGDRMATKDENGKIQLLKYSDFQEDFVLDASLAQSWADVVKSWFLPATFLICFIWQAAWKGVQTLLVATVVTLVQQSRPSFSVHLKLAIMALCPAMMFGVFVWASELFFISLPWTGTLFWVILGGLTWWGSDQLKKTPEYS